MALRRAFLLSLLAFVFSAGPVAASAARDCTLDGVFQPDASGGPDEFLVSAVYDAAADGADRLSGGYLRWYTVDGQSVKRDGRVIQDEGEASGALGGGTWTLEFRYQEGATGDAGLIRATGEGALDGNRLVLRGTYEVVEGHGGGGSFKLKGKCVKR